MPPEQSELIARARAAIAAAGLDWPRLWSEATEIVIFGSSAAGLAGPHSDTDILLVSEGQASRKTRHLDLLAYSPQKLHTQEWLRSELAGHIAAYGRWLKKGPSWVSEVKVGEAARARKQARIERLVAAAQRHWPRLEPEFRRRSLLTIRREMQREQLLSASVPIPPTPELDRLFAMYEMPEAFRMVSAELTCSRRAISVPVR